MEEKLKVESITFCDDYGTIVIEDIKNKVKPAKDEHCYRIKKSNNRYKLLEKIRLQNGFDVEYQRYYSDISVLEIVDEEDREIIHTDFEVVGITANGQFIKKEDLLKNVKRTYDWCDLYNNYVDSIEPSECDAEECEFCRNIYKNHSVIYEYANLEVEYHESTGMFVIFVDK